MPGTSDTDQSQITRIIVYNVSFGKGNEFKAWQKLINDSLQQSAGILGIEVLPHTVSDSSHEWVVMYRFCNDEALLTWLNSNERANALAIAPDIFTSKPSEYTLTGVNPPDYAKTLIINNKVIHGKEAEYEAAERALHEAAARFPGFVGCKVFKPTANNDNWSTLMHFNNKDSMERWLNSPERAAGVEILHQFVATHNLNVIPTGFGSWFAINADDGITAPAWKQAMVVICALFPITLGFKLTAGNFLSAEGVPVAINGFISTLFGTLSLTWLLMPVLAKLMSWWLSPKCALKQSLLGTFLFFCVYAIEILSFLYANEFTQAVTNYAREHASILTRFQPGPMD
jgi:antibiotic biosynthesis monooxygenase (ABM) superfamily enzyme